MRTRLLSGSEGSKGWCMAVVLLKDFYRTIHNTQLYKRSTLPTTIGPGAGQSGASGQGQSGDSPRAGDGEPAAAEGCGK